MSTVTKYFYKGENTDLIVFAASEELVDEYLKNPSIGKLSEVVELFEVSLLRTVGVPRVSWRCLQGPSGK